MLIDALPTLSNTIMHHKHLSRLMAKSMNELAHKSPLILLSECALAAGHARSGNKYIFVCITDLVRAGYLKLLN